MTDTHCFSRSELQQFLLGELPDTASDRVATHVEACAACDATVAELDRESDTLIESLRAPVTEEAAGSVYRLAAKRAVIRCRDMTVELDRASNDGRRLLRDYELIEPLAQGGMGTVYRARHLRLNRQVALKVLPGRWLENPAIVARFEREMQAVGSLHHPAIVQATDGGDADGVHFLVMELIDGCDGSQLVQALGPLPIEDACDIVRQAAEGMAYAHEQGIIHRDLKPSNLMVTQRGEAKVLDLGLARIVSEQLGEDELTTVGQLMGTLDYMAPEQLDDSHQVDERADIYSLGATLYMLLCGCSPHTSASREPLLSKLRRISSEPAVPLRERRPEAPPELCELLDQMLAHDVQQRPSEMRIVAEKLNEFIGSSDLAERVAEAIELRKGRQAPLAQFPDRAALAETAQPSGRAEPPRGGRWLPIAAALLLLTTMALGIVVTLHTTSGRLVIETSEPDVEVRILKAGKAYRSLTLEQSANLLRLGAGEYEIEIEGESTGLEIDNGHYTLKRGETWVARIVHSPNAAGPPAAPGPGVATAAGAMNLPGVTPPDAPTYDGMTLDQWLAQLRKERSPKQLYEACKALEKLARGEDTARAVDALLVAVQFHSERARYRSGETSWLLWSSVRDVLDSRDQAVVVAVLNRELERGNRENFDFILYYLARNADDVRPFADASLLAHVERLTAAETPEIRQDAIDVLEQLAPHSTVVRRLVAALSDSSAEIQLQAARLLMERESETPLVVSTLARLTRAGELTHRAEAAWRLGELGEAARSAVPDLAAIVKDDDPETRENVVFRSIDGKQTMVSVPNAAVWALGEIGDPSVVPLLIEEWEHRVRVRDRGQQNRVAAVIERLAGIRPEHHRGSSGDYTIWMADGASLSHWYERVFMRAFVADRVPMENIMKLLRRAQDHELEESRHRIDKIDFDESPELLVLQIELAEALGRRYDHRLVLESVFRRLARFPRIHHSAWDENRTGATIEAYRECAVRILHGSPDWKTAGITHLLELAAIEKNYLAAGVVLLEVLGELGPERQTDAVVRVLQSFGKNGKRYYSPSQPKLVEWMSDDAHRAAIQQRLEQLSDDDWEWLTLGLFRAGLADENLRRMLWAKFGEDSINRSDVLKWLIASLDDNPGAAAVIIELVQHPALDAPASVNARGNERTEVSHRARSYLPMLKVVPRAHREQFRPLLLNLAKTGERNEDAAARDVLESWK